MSAAETVQPTFLHLVRNVLLLTCAFYGLPLLMAGYCITGLGGWFFLSEIFILPILLSPFISLFWLIKYWKRSKKQALSLAILAMASIALMLVPSMILSSKLRSFGFLLVTYRAEPLIKAIENYTEDHHGIPPSSLEEIIPTYIKRIPTRIPTLKYTMAKIGNDRYGWSLSAKTPTGILNFDDFSYVHGIDCEEFYSDSRFGNVECIGDWAYTHE